VGVSHDMTRQKQIEEVLRSREKFLSELNEITGYALKVSNVPDLFQLLAGHMHKLLSSDVCYITFWDDVNKKTIPMAASGIGKNDYIDQHHLPRELTFTESVLKAGKPLVAEDVFNTPFLSRKIAELFPTKSLLGLPLIVDEVKLGSVLIGFITPHKFSQQEIEYGTIAANQIALIISKTKILDQLMQSEKDLIKLNAEKDRLFSIIAHDLRSPFNSFLGLTELMAEEESDFTIAEMRKFAKAIQQSAKGLFQLLENLLQWSRLQGGTIEFNPVEVNLREIIDNSFESLQGNAIRKEIEIANFVPDDMVLKKADAKMMQSLTGNLLSNAIKFTPKGGKVTVSAIREDGWVKLNVEDTGTGMSPETLNNLFRIDVQVSRPGTEGESSSGLGLILCKEFVERHQGKINVKSTLGKGSIFVVEIPDSLH
ncbi:MAG TPA: GAF domain-containing protein, partial [Bacteroidales bacterium]|nr:GAF domain-containing protein [Bacteroidales bacterium]